MSQTELSDELRQFVRQRAGNRCEYCLSHQDYIMGRLQIDHILPVVRGGPNTKGNTCLACELCNQYKWTHIDGIDPETNARNRLYNPRIDRWSDHFEWDTTGARILGLTAIGRATVLVLNLNNDLAIVVRRNWIKAGWHPPNR